MLAIVVVAALWLALTVLALGACVMAGRADRLVELDGRPRAARAPGESGVQAGLAELEQAGMEGAAVAPAAGTAGSSAPAGPASLGPSRLA